MDQNRFYLIFKRSKSKQPHGYGTKIKPTSNLRSKILTPNFANQSQNFKIGGPRSFIFFFNLACILFVLFLFGLGLEYFISPSIDYISLFELCFLSYLVKPDIPVETIF